MLARKEFCADIDREQIRARSIDSELSIVVDYLNCLLAAPSHGDKLTRTPRAHRKPCVFDAGDDAAYVLARRRGSNRQVPETPDMRGVRIFIVVNEATGLSQ